MIGVRHALESGRGTASVPVGTALFGSVLAVMALSATVVFANSLTHLTATPALYGSDYQLSFSSSNGGPGNPTSWVSSLKHDHAITAIMLAVSDEVSINGHDVLAIAGKPERGPMLLSTVEGRLPTAEHDMVLGVTTLHQLGAHVGSVLGVTVQLPSGGSRTVPFRVVGTASFPSDAGGGGLGSGSAFTMAGYLNAVCPPGREESRCQQAFAASQDFIVLARATSGPKGQAAHRPLRRPRQRDPAGHPDLVGQLRGGGELPAHPRVCAGSVRRGDSPPSARGQRGPAPPGDGATQGARLRERAGRRNRALASHDGCPGGHRRRRPARHRRRPGHLECLCHQPRCSARRRRSRADDRCPGGRRARGRQRAGRHPGRHLGRGRSVAQLLRTE